jgi:hypothetical protein
VDLQNSKLLVSGRGSGQGISLDTSIRKVQAKGGAEEADHRRALCRDKLQWWGKGSASTETPQCPTCARSQLWGLPGFAPPRLCKDLAHWRARVELLMQVLLYSDCNAVCPSLNQFKYFLGPVFIISRAYVFKLYLGRFSAVGDRFDVSKRFSPCSGHRW